MDATVWGIQDLELASVPVVHPFELMGDTPTHSRARRMPPKHNCVLKKELNELLEAGIITPVS